MRTRPRAPSWVRVAFVVADLWVARVLFTRSRRPTSRRRAPPPPHSSVHCKYRRRRPFLAPPAERSSLPPTHTRPRTVPVGSDFQQQDDDAEFERQLEELMRQVDSVCLAAAEGAVDDNTTMLLPSPTTTGA
jgi:hypothetical protein